MKQVWRVYGSSGQYADIPAESAEQARLLYYQNYEPVIVQVELAPDQDSFTDRAFVKNGDWRDL